MANHTHRWQLSEANVMSPDRLHLSINMERDDAKTVSMTVVEVRPAQLTMRYAMGVPDFHEMMSEHVLPLPSTRLV